MRVMVEQVNYLTSVSDTAGLRLVVHDQRSMPFPEDDGISIGPGTKTFVGFKRVRLRKYFCNEYLLLFPRNSAKKARKRVRKTASFN